MLKTEVSYKLQSDMFYLSKVWMHNCVITEKCPLSDGAQETAPLI